MMNRGLVATLSCVAIWLGGIAAASADEAVAAGAGSGGYGTAGGFGVGASVTHRGEPGVSLYYVAAPRIGIQGIVHFDSLSNDDNSSSNLGLSVNGLYSLIADGSFQLPALLGIDFSRSASDAGGMDVSTSGVALLLGVQPAWWPAPEVSFHLTLGLRIDLASDGDEGGVGEGTDIAFPGTPEFLGSAAVTFWIK
jgi:hypothetical protein